jgi:hypothetical protein
MTSRTFWLVAITVFSGNAGALILPAIPRFDWLKASTGFFYGSATGLVTAYIGQNVFDTFIRFKNGLKNGNNGDNGKATGA